MRDRVTCLGLENNPTTESLGLGAESKSTTDCESCKSIHTSAKQDCHTVTPLSKHVILQLSDLKPAISSFGQHDNDHDHADADADCACTHQCVKGRVFSVVFKESWCLPALVMYGVTDIDRGHCHIVA